MVPNHILKSPLWSYIDMESNAFNLKKFNTWKESKKYVNVGENIFSGTVIMSTYLWEELKVTFLTQS